MRYICSTKDHDYRDTTNPLRGLNLSRLVALQEAGAVSGCRRGNKQSFSFM